MQYRKLGNTGLEVSVLAFGGSSLGSEFGPIDEVEGIRAVHAAVDNGINLIDTAPYYGLTTAEAVLGKALREIPREKYYLATKVGRYGKTQEGFDFSASRVTQSVDESLRRLNVEYVDFIQVHAYGWQGFDRGFQSPLAGLSGASAPGEPANRSGRCVESGHRGQ
jgi:L-galactose dehydrogenase